MKAHFRVPMNSATTAQYLLAAVSAEVEYRQRKFAMSDELNKQIGSVADWLCGLSNKNSLLFAGGCGNGKTTFVYAMQNLLNHLNIKNEVTGLNFGIVLSNAKDLANTCKTNPKEWRSIMDKDILASHVSGIL